MTAAVGDSSWRDYDVTHSITCVWSQNDPDNDRKLMWVCFTLDFIQIRRKIFILITKVLLGALIFFPFFFVNNTGLQCFRNDLFQTLKVLNVTDLNQINC